MVQKAMRKYRSKESQLSPLKPASSGGQQENGKKQGDMAGACGHVSRCDGLGGGGRKEKCLAGQWVVQMVKSWCATRQPIKHTA